MIFHFLLIVILRYTSNYLYLRSHETNGLYALVLLRASNYFITFQPILLGLVLLARKKFGLGAASLAIGVALITFLLLWDFLRRSSNKRLRPSTEQNLATFERGATDGSFVEDEEARSVSRASLIGGRRSLASILDLVDSISRNSARPALPLPSEQVNSFADARAAATSHFLKPPNLPELAFEEEATLRARESLYPPVLVESRPAVILPNDPLAHSESMDLERWGILSVSEEAPPLYLLPKMGKVGVGRVEKEGLESGFQKAI